MEGAVFYKCLEHANTGWGAIFNRYDGVSSLVSVANETLADEGLESKLHHAARLKDLELSQRLIDAGAFVNADRFYGQNPSSHAFYLLSR